MTYNVFTRSGAVRDYHVSRAWFRVVRMKAFVVDCRNGNRVYAVRVAIKVALVAISRTIAAGEHKDGAFSAATVVDAFEDCLLNEIGWTLHGLTIIWGAPTAAVDRHVLVSVVERRCFVDIRDGAGKNTDAGDLCFVCDSHATCIVLSCSNLTCAARAVMVVAQLWSGQILVVIEVVRVDSILNSSQSLKLACGKWETHKVVLQVVIVIV